MVSSELGACEWFVWDLRRANLIDRVRLDEVIHGFLAKRPGAEPAELAEHLVAQELMTQFQAERLLQGKTQGFVLGPFTLMDVLGTGSLGTVYKAQSKTDQKWHAVKVVPRRSMWNVRIARRKVRAFESCKHPSVVPFVDVGTAGGIHYLAWPLVHGETLDKVIERDGQLDIGFAANLALQTAEGLDNCHQQGLIHGLLKPSNLMLTEGDQILILDLGIGCLLAETEGESLVDTMSTANAVTSGLDCASPESILEPTNLTPAGDQYGLGCILYYFLTGRYPFPDGNAAEKMMAHQMKQPTPLAQLVPGIPAELVAVVERLMQKAPDKRFASMSDAVQALKPFAGARSTVKGPGRRPAPAAEPTLPSAAPAGWVAPSNPTPRPPIGLGSLPSRNSLRPFVSPTAPARPPEPEPECDVEVVEEAVVIDEPTESTGWRAEIRPALTALATLSLCGLAYAAAIWFELI